MITYKSSHLTGITDFLKRRKIKKCLTDEWECDKMYELLKKSNKTLKNKLKKFLTKTSECDKIKKLCRKKRTHKTLITE